MLDVAWNPMILGNWTVKTVEKKFTDIHKDKNFHKHNQ